MGEANVEIVRRLWERMEARDWTGVAACLAEDVEIEWPHSGERIRGSANYVEIMRNYPAVWSVAVVRVVGSGNEAAADIRVESEGAVHHAACFYEVAGGVVRSGTEYYLQAGWFEPPAWRSEWVETENIHGE